MSSYKSKNCRFKQIMTKTGTVKNSCVADKNAITMDPDCLYNISTGKCVINRVNVPAKKKVKRRSPMKSLVFQPAEVLLPGYIAKPVASKGHCRFKTSITKDNKLKNSCVEDKNISASDSRCKRSSYGRCILSKPEPLKVPSFYNQYKPVQPVMAEQKKREYIKLAANKDLAERLRQVQMRPLYEMNVNRPKLMKTPVVKRTSPIPPPPPYTDSMLARRALNFM
jgi:hypothetical protein